MSAADFTAAQQRIAARRRSREAENQARVSHDRRFPASATIDSLPGSLSQADNILKDIWDLIRGREGTRPAYRVGQVDAELLDEELLDLLKGQIQDALKYFGPHLQDDWSSEILLALRAVLFKLSIWDHDASYGAALQNLKYVDARYKGPVPRPPSKWQKSVYGLFTIGARYAWGKWEDWLVDMEGGFEQPSANVRLFSRLSTTVSTAHSLAAFVSFLIFLFNGKYRTLLDRVLRLRLATPTSQVNREVSFEYLNRQLVWHAFTEFLLFILPLVGISRWRRWLGRAWRKMRSLMPRTGDDNGEDSRSTGPLGFLPERTCAICYHDQNPISTSEDNVLAMSGASGGVIGSAQTDVTNPYEAIPCGCIYCFVCLAQRLESEEGEGWACLRCGEIVNQCRPWNGDVLEEEEEGVKPATEKSVGFIDDNHDEDGLTQLDPSPENDTEKDRFETPMQELANSPAVRPFDVSSEWAQVDSLSGEAPTSPH
ncbi:hypothetical protein L228DRAFT_230061 [Xylona heveae TC161]|uniref:Pex N-terminal domain-containing protein n=1 Tax=Xylona heveae (strain CBS 132557 / TC161) TaxID=1328760 RepID=A0A165H1F0_XYLHT|nr:hypothetical protein L228DRAFT_230061 [Xylona heveae TC161]KZF22863.1 hypothetical protein L228DRAFT_230061 [Xylona heveae TC161]